MANLIYIWGLPMQSVAFRTRLNLPRQKKNSIHFKAYSTKKQSPGEEEFVAELKLPVEWSFAPSQEAEWLRTSLNRWLDDEYCPEPANVEISKRCAAVYYRCLVEKELDAGNILMRMVENLETFSFKESFHGAFSSANAAIDLILKKRQSGSN